MLTDSLFQANNDLQELQNQKQAAEKQNTICLNRIKFFEERIEANHLSIRKKDNEMSDLSAKLRELSGQADRLRSDLNESIAKSKLCEDSKKLPDDFNMTKTLLINENSELKSQLNSLNEKIKLTGSLMDIGKCQSLINANLVDKIDKNFNDAALVSKLKEVLNLTENLQVQQTQQVQDHNLNLNLQKRSDEEVNTENNNINCLLPLVTGDCNEALTRYFFDKEKKECLQFTYTGCQGNLNNFITEEICQESCEIKLLDKNEQIALKTTDSLTPDLEKEAEDSKHVVERDGLEKVELMEANKAQDMN